MNFLDVKESKKSLNVTSSGALQVTVLVRVLFEAVLLGERQKYRAIQDTHTHTHTYVNTMIRRHANM
jgi:hypothetical protein